ncbi:hypothetical protein D3C80_2016340 [compost metagenome]
MEEEEAEDNDNDDDGDEGVKGDTSDDDAVEACDGPITVLPFSFVMTSCCIK